MNEIYEVVAAAPVGILWVDKSGSILAANPHAEEVFGYESDELTGLALEMLVPEEKRDIHKRMCVEYQDELITRPMGRGRELVGLRKDGVRLAVEVALGPVQTDRGIVVGVFIADITKRREAEALRESLIHMLVHDLRSPLQGITTALHLLQLDLPEQMEESRQDVSMALRSSSALVTIINDVLDISRMEAGEMPLDVGECDMWSVADRALDSIAGLARDRVVLEAQRNEPVLVDCDAGVMQRVIANLVGNALKFTPEEGEVSFAVTSGDGRVRCSVRDTGPGIVREHHQKIFEKYGQVEVRQAGQKVSTGLGLAFCKLAVEAHGGDIGVESEVGSGSTFWFELPSKVQVEGIDKRS